MKTLYITRVTVSGGRDGTARSDDGKLDLALALPVDIGGSGNGTNPEQLFAAGFGACFTSSLAHAARGMGLAPSGIGVAAEVKLTVDDNGAFGVIPALSVTLSGLTDADADRVITEARRICAYSNAMKQVITPEIVRA
ncbi:Ohr family peroxiredoxin [Tabrizicola sp.]|uniref:Ohr family peroxiredoxin n=1 Tax=Tabrizicola sp. TaxID=2005166 RepID=UPI003F2B67A5